MRVYNSRLLSCATLTLAFVSVSASASILVEDEGRQICANIIPISFYPNTTTPREIGVHPIHVQPVGERCPQGWGMAPSSLSVVERSNLRGIAGGCVSEDTWVLTPRGLVKISDLQIGAEVIGFDPASGKSLVTKVTRVSEFLVDYVAEVTLKVGASTRKLTATINHPILFTDASDSDRRYGQVYDWENQKVPVEHSAALIDPTGIDSARIIDVRLKHMRAPKRMMDIEVESHVANFIGNGVIVHNSNH